MKETLKGPKPQVEGGGRERDTRIGELPPSTALLQASPRRANTALRHLPPVAEREARSLQNFFLSPDYRGYMRKKTLKEILFLDGVLGDKCWF